MNKDEQDRIVEEWRASGMTMKEFSALHNINYRTMNGYSYWYNVRHGLTRNQRKTEDTIVELIPVKSEPSQLTIEAGNLKIRVNDNTDLNLLKKVAAVLEHD